MLLGGIPVKGVDERQVSTLIHAKVIRRMISRFALGDCHPLKQGLRRSV